jgi:hypothetical protein
VGKDDIAAYEQELLVYGARAKKKIKTIPEQPFMAM